jgi:hypothetical protein
MGILNLYYAVKPLIPHRVRLYLRRLLAAKRRRRNVDTWPINRAAAAIPDWWKGWPDKKQFAFVLTHDVEGQKGVDRCRQLADLERNLGFRSSYNFVPEGHYALAQILRQHLELNGFEIGVHDLHHDGTLYRSESDFRNSATAINKYLKEWNAAGFRSAFMFHNLEWIKQLDIQYDASTFDTDPFEPQPDNSATIYPFIVSRDDGSSFVELPYTLVQDSTLFLVLREKTNNIWKAKLDWVAENGGMALINVHPDYMTFNERAGYAEYQAELYRDFLLYVSKKYGKDAWCALPKDVAAHVSNMTHSISKQK